MTLNSVFYDGVVTETDRAKNRAGVPDYGVYGVGDFEVKAHPSIAYAVLVKAGKAHGFGVTDEATVDQVVQCGTISSGTRWDLIVVRRNWQPALGGPSTLVAIPGGPVAEIPAGRKVGPGVEDDQPIALVKWQGGLSAPAQIIDLRVWAANGGLFAKEDLVRTYLTGVGTEVNVNGTNWTCAIGANNTVTWAKSSEIGKIPLFGFGAALQGSPASGQEGFLVQAGTVVNTSDGAGYARITWPKPFPNGVLSVHLTSGDDWVTGAPAFFAPAGRPDFWGTAGYGDKKELVYAMTGLSGKTPNKLHRVNYTVTGW